MKVRSLTFRGVKGGARTLPLPSRLILSGPVGSGKSTILDALRFGFLGHVPALGKAEASTARILSGESMDVALTLADERIALRTLTRDGRKLSILSKASWLPPEATATEHGDAIARLAGSSLDEAAQHLDVRALLNAGPGDRLRDVNALLEDKGASVDALRARAKALAYARAAAWEKPIPDGVNVAAFVDALIAFGLEPAQAAAIEAVGTSVLPVFGTEGLAAALAAAKRAATDARADAKQKVAARAEIEARSVAAGTPTESLEALRARRGELERARGAATAAADEARRHGAEMDAARAEVVRTGSVVAGAVLDAGRAPTMLALAECSATERAALVDPAAPPAAVMFEANPEALAKAEALRTEADGIVAPPEVARPALVTEDAAKIAEAASVEAKAAEIEARGYPAPPRLLALPSTEAKAAAVKAATSDLAAGTMDPWTKVREHADTIDEAVKVGAGRLPDEVSTPTAALRLLASEYGANLSDLRLHVEQARAALADVERQAKDVAESNLAKQAEYDEAVRIADAVRAECADFRAYARGIREKESARVAAVNGAALAEYDRLRAARDNAASVRARRADDLRREAATLERDARAGAAAANADARSAARAAADAHAATLTANRSRRVELEMVERTNRSNAERLERNLAEARTAAAAAVKAVADLEAKPIGSVAEAVAAGDAAAAELAGLVAKVDALEAASARARELGDLAGAIARQEAAAKAAGAYAWAFERLREEEMGRKGGPLLSRLSAFLDAAKAPTMLGAVPYLRAAKGNVEMGILRGGVETDLVGLSGETAIYLAGLAAAVIAIRNPEVRLLMVEAAELGEADPLYAVLRGLEAVAGDLDHVIVATCNAVDPARAARWEILNLGAVPAVA